MKSSCKAVCRFLLVPALLTIIHAGSVCAGLLGREKLQAVRADKAIVVDGILSEWPVVADTFEINGLRFRAAYDSKNLFISVSAHESSAKMVLTGQARQDVTFWFLAAKTRTVGLRLPYGKLGVPQGPEIPKSPEPEFLASGNAIIPSTTIPQGIEIMGQLTDRYPAYELKIPLNELLTAEGKVSLDFETSYASADLKKKMKEKLEEAGKRFQSKTEKVPGAGDGPPGMRGVGGMQGGMPPQGAGGPPRGGPGGFTPPELPDTVTAKVSIILDEYK